MYTNHMTGNTFLSSHVPNVFLKYTDNMNFWERAHNVITWKLDEAFMYFYHYPKQRKLYETFFPQAVKSFDEQRKSISLLLNNNHFSSSTVRPGMPNVIDIGGNHVEPAKPLPEDIQEFLDSAKDGAILFSMGSIIQAVQWPIEQREAFVNVFKKLKIKVLWKYENDTLPNKPENVMISPWIPQRDILAHPNIKLFITHGGLLGASEALTEGVPVLGIPIFGDQRMNMNLGIAKGYALALDFDDVSEESLTVALDTILNDHKISQRAKEISKIFTDRPMSPQQNVVYWVEYVVRHKGAKHLRSAGLELSYAELYSLDVYGALIVTFAGIIFMFCAVIKCFAKVLIDTESQIPKFKVN
jgi:glucuronosyltransferase